MGTLAIVAGIACIIISILFLIPDFKKAKNVKEKWNVLFDFVISSLDGLSSIFYLGLLLILFGFLVVSDLL